MLLILFLSVFIFLGYLIFENITLNRHLRTISLRICVTGTRGKSSVVRMLAAILREDGRKVLAKMTGSRAVYILPDGEEVAVRRRGLTSIIEQKNLVKKAAHMNVACLIAEIMSIHPENHFTESRKILKPDIVVITNVRLDHTDAMGEHEDDIAAVFALVITKKSTVFIPEKENRPVFSTAVENDGGELICVQEGLPGKIDQKLNTRFFPENISLVKSLCKHLEISQTNILKGLNKVKPDTGEFKVWKSVSKETKKTFFLANGFAVNDPESTFALISEINRGFPFASGQLTGVLSLRADRVDRTLQWIEALKKGGIAYFKRLFVTGTHAGIVRRKLKNSPIMVLKHKEPEKVMDEIITDLSGCEGSENECVIFGFGNIQGTGTMLINYWKTIGEEYGC
ncbi:poly-gamma-glutamate synthase PgsB [Acidobacteriota bacterium]